MANSFRARAWGQLPQADAETGISAADLASAGCGSEVAIRRALRLWAKAGLLIRDEGSSLNGEPHRYRRAPNAPELPPKIGSDDGVTPRVQAMLPAEFAARRRKLGHSLVSMGQALGLSGHKASISRSVRRYEAGVRLIGEDLAQRVRALRPASDLPPAD